MLLLLTLLIFPMLCACLWPKYKVIDGNKVNKEQKVSNCNFGNIGAEPVITVPYAGGDNVFGGSVFERVPNGSVKFRLASGEIYCALVVNDLSEDNGNFPWTNGDKYV